MASCDAHHSRAAACRCALQAEEEQKRTSSLLLRMKKKRKKAYQDQRRCALPHIPFRHQYAIGLLHSSTNPPLSTFIYMHGYATFLSQDEAPTQLHVATNTPYSLTVISLRAKWPFRVQMRTSLDNYVIGNAWNFKLRNKHSISNLQLFLQNSTRVDEEKKVNK